MSNGNDDDFENTTKKYFLVVKIFFVFNCNWNWKCLGEKSPKHLFFGKNWNFFGSIFTRFTRGLSSLKGLQKRGVWSKSKSRVCKNGACGRRATGGLLLGLSEEQQGGLLLPGPKWSVRWLWSNLHFTINYEQRMFSLSNVLTWCNLTCRNFGPVNHCSYFHSSTSFQVSILRFFILWTVTHTSHFLFSSSFSSIRFVILRTCKA